MKKFVPGDSSNPLLPPGKEVAIMNSGAWQSQMERLKYQMNPPTEMHHVQLLPPSTRSTPNMATHVDTQEAPRRGHMHTFNLATHLEGPRDVLRDDDLEEEDEDEEVEMPDRDDFKRAEIRASVFDTYAICSALFAGFSVSQPSFNATGIEVSNRFDTGDFRITALHIQQWLLYVCTAGSVYSCTVFTFCALYSKTALAHPTQGLELLDNFLKETANFRKHAFYMMYFTTILFSTSIVWQVFQSSQVELALVATVPLLVVIVSTARHSYGVLQAATPIFVHAAKIAGEKAKAKAESDRLQEEQERMHSPNRPNPNEAHG